MSKDTLELQVKKHNTGIASLTTEKLQETLLNDLEAAVKQLDALRMGDKDRKCVDLSLGQYANERWGFSINDKTENPDGLFEALGIDPGKHSVESLFTFPEFNSNHRWLVPEIFREAIRLGLRKAPLYNNLIAGEETVSQKSITMPHINMSEAMPKELNEAETIPYGSVSFGEKTVKIEKHGIGIQVTDEVLQYVPLNIVNLFLQDVGVKLGRGLDVKALNVLVNGDQADLSEAAAVIGVETASAWEYRDLLRAWIRMGRLGRGPQRLLSQEDVALDVLDIPEFKALAGVGTLQNIQISTPIPSSQAYDIHGALPANHLMLVDTKSAMVKLTSSALRVESERIVSKQINGTYASITTGFANIFRDGRLLINNAVLFSGNGFPTWMDVDAIETEAFK